MQMHGLNVINHDTNNKNTKKYSGLPQETGGGRFLYAFVFSGLG